MGFTHLAIPVSPPEPSDPDWLRIKEMEARTIPLVPDGKEHKFVAATLRTLTCSRNPGSVYIVGNLTGILNAARKISAALTAVHAGRDDRSHHQRVGIMDISW
jgi:hypothetical protein